MPKVPHFFMKVYKKISKIYTLNSHILGVQPDLKYFSAFLPHPPNELLLAKLQAVFKKLA